MLPTKNAAKNCSASETHILSDLAPKYPEIQTTPKNPDLVEKPQYPISWVPMLNQWQIEDSVSQDVIELESGNLVRE